MTKAAERLSQSIRGFIEQKKLKQAEVARQAGMSPQQLNDTLSGVDAKFSTIEKIALALGVPTFYLLMSPQERAKWDEANRDQSAIERRFAAIEAKLSSLKAPLDESPPSLKDLAAHAQEMQRVIDAAPSKKYVRKKGNE